MLSPVGTAQGASPPLDAFKASSAGAGSCLR